MTLLATFIVALVFGPALVIAPAFLVLSLLGMLAGDGPRAVRKVFWCPMRRRTVTADFLVAASGAAQPSAVASCSAFADPRRVTCAQRCLEGTEVRWTPPVAVFARWALPTTTATT